MNEYENKQLWVYWEIKGMTQLFARVLPINSKKGTVYGKISDQSARGLFYCYL